MRPGRLRFLGAGAPAPLAILLLAALLFVGAGGCAPDLSGYTVVGGGADGSVPRTDGGRPTEIPLNLGTPCPNPHIALAYDSSSSTEGGRLLRIDPSTGGECRASNALRDQGAFERGIKDVLAMPDGRLVLSSGYGYVGLGLDGFQEWRVQPYDASGEWAGPLSLYQYGGSLVAVGFVSGSSSIDWDMTLFDSRGATVLQDAGQASENAQFAIHPDGSGRLLLGVTYDIRVHSLPAASDLSASNGDPLLSDGSRFQLTDSGSIRNLDSDPPTGRLVVTYSDMVLSWRSGSGAPIAGQGKTCPSYCNTYYSATPDPTADGGMIAICGANEGGYRLLMRIGPDGGCSLLLDGSVDRSERTMWDLTLVRAAL